MSMSQMYMWMYEVNCVRDEGILIPPLANTPQYASSGLYKHVISTSVSKLVKLTLRLLIFFFHLLIKSHE